MPDFEELVAILAPNRVADDTFVGSHPSKNWVLYSTSPPVAADSRVLATGHFFDRSGQFPAVGLKLRDGSRP
jgi:acyl-CoA thioesterase